MNDPAFRPAIDSTLLVQARARSTASGRSAMHELAALTQLEEDELLYAVSDLLGWPVLTTAEMQGMAPAFDIVPLARAMQRGAVLLRAADGALTAVVPDPFDNDLLTWVETRAQQKLHLALSRASDIQAFLSLQEATTRVMDAALTSVSAEARSGKSASVLSFESVSSTSSPAVKLVDSTIYDGLKANASDIHLETIPSGLVVRYRIDGVLDHAASIQGYQLAEQAISRLKVLAELDIAEKRTPQDGSFRVEVGGREIDLRVSIMPSIYGEDAVVRILDKRAMVEAYGSLTLEALGFDSESLQALRQFSEQPYGMLLVTGPTGSGKTTTLYAVISEIHDGKDKIITIEDPVEYQLAGVLQIPVNDKKGLTFARGLRSILRHDPDKIMIGEIRDRETAEIAVQSALTGHLVLTTVHANNVFDVFGRFTHMGIDPYAFVSALNGIWAQRLVRLNCPKCATDHAPSEADLRKVSLTRASTSDFQFRAAPGCGDCRGTGYKGRKAIAEILALNEELRDLVVERAPMRLVREAAYKNGTRLLREAALALVRSGETTLDEVKRVTQNT